MIYDGFLEPFVQVVVGPFVLQVRVSVSTESLGVIDLHVGVVGSQHVYHCQVNDSLFPTVDSSLLEVLLSTFFVIFNFIHCTFMSHVPLPHKVGHGVDL